MSILRKTNVSCRQYFAGRVAAQYLKLLFHDVVLNWFRLVLKDTGVVYKRAPSFS